MDWLHKAAATDWHLAYRIADHVGLGEDVASSRHVSSQTLECSSISAKAGRNACAGSGVDWGRADRDYHHFSEPDTGQSPCRSGNRIDRHRLGV